GVDRAVTGGDEGLAARQVLQALDAVVGQVARGRDRGAVVVERDPAGGALEVTARPAPGGVDLGQFGVGGFRVGGRAGGGGGGGGAEEGGGKAGLGIGVGGNIQVGVRGAEVAGAHGAGTERELRGGIEGDPRDHGFVLVEVTQGLVAAVLDREVVAHAAQLAV